MTRRERIVKTRERTFLINGGASGLGAATARRLVAGGAHVIVADINVQMGSAVADELGGGATFVEMDITQEDSV